MKILVIRFSSIGDLTQALSIPARIHEIYPDADVHFLTRSDFTLLLENNPQIQKIWSIDRKQGLSALLKIAKELNQENFDVIYDAHNNLRSFFIRNFVSAQTKIIKPMYRIKRFLLINCKINLFEKPFSGQRDLLRPLEKINIPFQLPKTPLIFFNDQVNEKINTLLKNHSLENYLVIVPSAAYQLKRWPVDYWHQLITTNPNKKIVLLAGPIDTFTAQFNQYTNVTNLTGKTSLIESASIISKANMVVTNDTGMLHFSEQLGKKTVALMGPAPFGFPSRPSTLILEKDLPCRPCSKHGQGPCVNKNYQECMTALTPQMVQNHIEKVWAN